MDRRNFLTIGGPRSREAIRGEAPGALPSNSGSQGTPLFERRSGSDLTPYAGPWSWAQAAHLLRRTMFGPSNAEILQAVSDGMSTTLEKLFTPSTPVTDGIESWMNGTQFQLQPDTANGEDTTTYLNAQYERRYYFIRSIILSMKNSPVSIQERLAFFWHGHFTSEIEVVRFPELTYEQYKLYRRMMLGNFKQFTFDVTTDLAMLIYLDGAKNLKAGNFNNINENYARELMELFTMGVFDWNGNPNYTQDDVIAAARSLSGWTYNANLANPRQLVFVDRASKYNPLYWDNGTKTLLGQTGTWKAEDVINIIFQQRADQIAKFICEKIYRGFVYDVADPVVVEQMAQTFRSNNWELRPVFDQLLRSEHFYDVTNIGAMHRSPVDYVVGQLRQLSITKVPGLDDLSNARANNDLGGRMTTFGQLPYDPPNVKGWPGGRTWNSTSTLPQKQKFSIDMAGGAIKIGGRPYYQFDPVAFARQFTDPNDLPLLAEEMARLLLNTEPSEPEMTMLYETILDGGKDYEWDIDDPNQKPDERIRKFVQAAVQLAKFQLY